jgi:hypothetical protein
MANMAGPLNSEYQAGQEVQYGKWTILPFAKTWHWRSPGGHQAIVWNRPASLWVRSETGDEEIIQIPDMTRRVVLSLVGVCLGAVLVVWALSTIYRKRK